MNTRTPTQRERVLNALRARGTRGITTTEFLAPDVCDGHAPILRVPSRVDELRAAGHRIETQRTPAGVARYVLRAEAPTAPATPLGDYLEHRAAIDAEHATRAEALDSTPTLFDEAGR